MIEREEAFLILKKLHEDRTPVFCGMRLREWSSDLFGSIARLDRNEVAFLSSDRKAACAFRLVADGLRFEYGEPKDIPEGVFGRGGGMDPSTASLAVLVGSLPSGDLKVFVFELPKSE